jgi:DNA gyrase subunit A
MTEQVLPSDSFFSNNIINREISYEMKDSYINYAMSVIISRALPDVRDGLKPVHRRILFAMHKNGLTSKAKFAKSARIVGDVIGKYHPHGDSSVYEAMVRMAQDFSMRYMLVKGQGNFGSIDGDKAAAMRYTEAKMSSITEEILADIDNETVDFRDNYDGSQQEPIVLPTKVPTLLLNGTMGIAVGMATNVPPHNLKELIDGINHLIDNPECTIDDLMDFIKGPDFPTAGKIYDKSVIKKAYATGRGSIIIRGVAEIIESKSGKNKIIITEIPYQVNKAVLVEKIAYLVKEKIITGVSDLRDESSNKDGIRIVITLKKDSFPKKILNLIYKNTQLQSSFGCNFIALINRGTQPQLLDLKSILQEFINHRIEVIKRKTEYELRLAKARAHILEGLSKALDNIDRIISVIRGSDTKEIAKEQLMKEFIFTEIQADAILAMKLQTLAGLERKKIENELLEKLEFIKDLEDILANEYRIIEIIKEQLIYIKEKYGDDRKTEVIDHGVGEISTKDIIPNMPMIITLSQCGYIKRLSPDMYRSQNRGGKGTLGSNEKQGDELKISLTSSNHNSLLFFTSKGRVFKLHVYEIPEVSKTAKGQAIINFLNLGEDEVITSIFDTTKYSGKYFFFCTEKGVVKKTESKLFENIRQNGLIAIGLKDNDILRWVKNSSEGNEVMIITSEGKGIRFKEDDVRSMGRSASGVRGIKLKPNDKVVGMDIIKSSDEKSKMLVIMENGNGKMTKISEYRSQTRGGTGIKTANITNKTGLLVSAKILYSDLKGDIILSTKSGQTIRMSLNDIPSLGRATQGVKLMKLKEKDIISSSSVIEFNEIEEENIFSEK